MHVPVMNSTFTVELPGSSPLLYQGFWPMNCRFVPFRSRSVPLVTCGFVNAS